MLKVYEIICWSIIPTILGFHYINLFIYADSRHQQKRFWKAIAQIHTRLAKANAEGIKYPTIGVNYKDRPFEIGIYKKEYTHQYSTYTIFINGEEAACYHQLDHVFKNTYYFERLNQRHRDEVTDIIYAAVKAIKKQEKEAREKPTKYDEHSYFN